MFPLTKSRGRRHGQLGFYTPSLVAELFSELLGTGRCIKVKVLLVSLPSLSKNLA